MTAKGEIGRLAKAFNDMVVTLDRTLRELQDEVTARKMTEEALRDNVEMLRATFESSDDGIIVLDSNKKITHYNSRYLEMWNIPYEQMITAKSSDIFNHIYVQLEGENRDEIANALIQSFQSGEKYRKIVHLKNGSVYESYSSPLIRDNKLVGRLFSYKDVTERMQYLAKIKDQEENYRTIFDSVNEAIFIHDKDSIKIIDVNRAACQIYQLSREELLKMDVGALSAGYEPYTSKEAAEKLRIAVTEGPHTFEWLARKKDGTLFWVEVSLKLSRIMGNERIIAVVRDISDRKKAEEALRESEERYRSIYENATMGIYRTTPEGELLLANPAFLKMFGYQTIEELMEMSKREDISERGYDREDFIRQFDDKSEVRGYESTWRKKNGQVVYLRENAKAIRDKNGKILYFEGLIEDITEQKKLQAEIAKVRMLLSNIVNSMPSVLIGVDPKGIITQWNRQAEFKSGIKSQKALGSPLNKVMPRLAEELNKVTETIRNRKIHFHPKVVEETEEGRRYSDITIYPLISNGVEGAVIRMDDVTDRVRIEEMMIQSEKMLMVGGLAAGMAHEINNPLAGMIQNAQVVVNRLSANLPANEKAALAHGTNMKAIRGFMKDRDILKMLELIQVTGKRAAQIVESMLSFSRKSDAGIVPVDINDLIKSTVELADSDYDLKKKYDFKKIKIDYKLDTTLPQIPCEPVKIQQVVLNLLKNSAQAMAGYAEQTIPTITIKTFLLDKYVQIEIEDNGPGMDEEIRKRVFEPFFSTKPVGVGTGLGLSVSYFIITENHKGQMQVESTPLQGTKFIIKLPLERIRL